MSRKSAKIEALIEQCRGQDLPAHYLGYFECFNRQLFYEAHDVLEELWLAEGKHGANYGFYKGLIQFAGAFVHLQKNRLRPAAALFKLSSSYLEKFPARHQQLEVTHLLSLAAEWIGFLEGAAFSENPLRRTSPPRLALQGKALPNHDSTLPGDADLN
jgi:predicted metal-dependent hydrolase